MEYSLNGMLKIGLRGRIKTWGTLDAYLTQLRMVARSFDIDYKEERREFAGIMIKASWEMKMVILYDFSMRMNRIKTLNERYFDAYEMVYDLKFCATRGLEYG